MEKKNKTGENLYNSNSFSFQGELNSTADNFPEMVKNFIQDNQNKQTVKTAHTVWFIGDNQLFIGEVVDYTENAGFIIDCGNCYFNADEIFATELQAQTRLNEIIGK